MMPSVRQSGEEQGTVSTRTLTVLLGVSRDIAQGPVESEVQTGRGIGMEGVWTFLSVEGDVCGGLSAGKRLFCEEQGL